MAVKVLRILCVFFSVVILLLCGCQKAEKSITVKTDFKACFTSNYKDMQIKGSVSNTGHNISEISISSPKALSGMKICCKNSDYSLSLDSCVCSADEAYFLQDSFPNTMINFLSTLNNGNFTLVSSDTQNNTYNADTKNGVCLFSTNKNGEVCNAKIKDADFSVVFSNIKVSQ